jgi:hypothetical protein
MQNLLRNSFIWPWSILLAYTLDNKTWKLFQAISSEISIILILLINKQRIPKREAFYVNFQQRICCKVDVINFFWVCRY